MTQLVELTGEFAKGHMGRAVPGSYFDHDRKAWVVDDPTPRSAAVALRLFPELALDYPELEAARDRLSQDVRPFDNATPYGKRIDADRVRAALAEDDKALYEFQQLDLGYMTDVLLEHGGAYIGWERGLGKTIATCCLIDQLECQQVLVVAPNTAKGPVWQAELERWCPWMEVVVLPNTKPKREKTLAHVKQLRDEGIPFVLVIHYEALAIIAGVKKQGRRRTMGTGWAKFGAWDLVVADEVHRVKNSDAQMSRALKKVNATMKLGLSGSIVQNHAEELFSPLQWLFPDRYRSKWRDWNDRYLDYVESNYGRLCIGIKLDQLAAMRQELGVFMVVRRKDDELDLPDLTEQTLIIELSAAQRHAYDQLLTTCATELEDGTRVKAQDGLVMLGKLRQVATGLDLLADGISDSTKLDLAIELIEDAEDEAFVVFTWFKAAGRALQARLNALGIPSYHVDGDTKPELRTDMIANFQRGMGRVFIGTLSTMSESVNLQRANNVIFLDRSWNPATNLQARDRVYRNGQTRPVTVTDIVAKDTVDELRVLPTIANKEALRRLILGGL